MTRASEELHISQPAISQSIKKLERQLGGALFLRSNKGMELTEEGKMFYGYIKGALELIGNAENEFSGFKDLSKGRLKIGISTALTKVVLLETIERFHKDYPNINIDISNELTSNLILDLQKGMLDFVIYIEGDTNEISINTSKLRQIEYCFVYNANYFEFINKISNLNNLNNYPLIMQKSGSNSRKFIDKFMSQNDIILSPKLEVVSQELVIEFTNIGLGIGFVIKDLAKKNHPNLKELRLIKPIPKSNLYLATNKSTSLTFACKKFLEYFREQKI
jgi:DNA-binding transcriptional LysR family regulator